MLLQRRHDVPLDKDASVRFLPWLIALMVYLAVLASAAAIAVGHLTERWDQGLSGRLTVQVPPADPESAGAGQEARVAAALEALRNVRGVRSAERLGQSEIAELLRPWLGDAVHSADLPLPALIDVSLDPGNPPSMELLRSSLSSAAPGTVVEDHARTLGRLLELTRTLQLLAVLVVVLVGAAAVMTVVFVTRTGLAVHRHVIELLHLIGAQDNYIARQFQRHALRLGLLGGLLGLALAAATLFGMSRVFAASQGVLVPELALGRSEWAALAAIPLLTALIAMVTARLTVLRTLAKLA